MTRVLIRIVTIAAFAIVVSLVAVGIPAALDSGAAWIASGLTLIGATTVLVSVSRRHKSAIARAVVAQLFVSRRGARHWGIR